MAAPNVTPSRESDDEEFARRLAHIRSLRRRVVIRYAAPPVILAVFVVPLYVFFHEPLAAAAIVLLPLLLFAVFIAMILMLLTLVSSVEQLEDCRCPRCGEKFFRKGFLFVPLAGRQCQSCGLPLNSRGTAQSSIRT